VWVSLEPLRRKINLKENGLSASFNLGNDACDLLHTNVSSITFELFLYEA
jgi:hypothetical protein